MMSYIQCSSVQRPTPSWRFTGKERDAETGLDFFLARYYSAAQGRFLSPDEFKGGPDDALTGQDIIASGPLPYADIRNPQTLNKYAYVLNDPLRYVDPDGHSYEVYDGETNTITIWADYGEPIGQYPANNNVALRDINGKYTNGPVENGSYPVRSADATGSGWMHAGEPERVNDFETPVC
jgi:RHS repeat-associated protein